MANKALQTALMVAVINKRADIAALLIENRSLYITTFHLLWQKLKPFSLTVKAEHPWNLPL